MLIALKNSGYFDRFIVDIEGEDLKHKLLVTTALEPSWGDNEEIVFLGEWCKKYSRKHVWQARISQTVNYHWRDREKLAIDHGYLEIIYEELLSKIASYLNQYHKVDHSVEYWRIIVGPWLLTYIPVLWDRWESLSSISGNKNRLTTKVINHNSEREIAKDYRHAINLFDSDWWNHQMFGAILNHRNDLGIEIEKINVDLTKHVKKSIDSVPSKLTLVLKDIIKVSDLFLEWFSPKKYKVVLFDSYFPRKILMQLCFRLGLNPRSHNRLGQHVLYPSGFDRKNISEIINFFSADKLKGSFEAFVSKIIIKDIPICHLEGYSALHKIQKHLCRAENIFTANAHFANELFKVWAAEQKLLGTKLIISSHGGALYPLYSVFNHQEKIADFRVIWGHEWIKGQIRLPPNKLYQKKYTYRPQGYVSLIDYDSLRYSYRCATIPMGPLSLEAYKQNARLINRLSPQIRSKLRVRPQIYGSWEKEQRYIDDFGPEIISSQPSVEAMILNSRLMICTYPQTVFSEAMVSGVPTMIIYLEELWEVQPIYSDLIALLKKSGIMHTNERTANIHIEKIYDDPMKWWNADMTIEARLLFNKLCITTDTDVLNSWAEFFEQLPSGDIKRVGEI